MAGHLPGDRLSACSLEKRGPVCSLGSRQMVETGPLAR